MVEIEQPAPRVVRRPSALVLVAFVAGVVPLALHVWAALHGSLAQDDFVVTHQAAAAGPFDLGYLFQDYHGHLQPGGFFLAAVLTWWAPLNFGVLMLPLLLMRAVATVLFWCLLVRCFGRRWALLVPFTVFTASPLLLVPTLWWSYGVQLVPVVLATAGALHAHVRFLRDGGRWWLGAFAWTLSGLAFYEKAAVIPVLLAGVTVLLGRSFREHRRYWAAHAALLAGFVAVFFVVTSSQVGQGAQPMTAGTVADLTGRMLGDTLLPGLAGGPWSGAGPGATWAPSPFVVVVLLLAAAVAVVAAGVRAGGRRAWAAWALLAAVFAVDVGLLALTRLREVGPGAGDDPRYVADLVLVAALCGAFAFLRPGAVAPSGGHRERPIALIVCVLLLASSAVGFSRLAPALRFERSAQYLGNVRAAVEENPDLVFYDTFVPSDVVHEWFGADSRASRVAGLLPGTHFDQPTNRMHQLDATGTPHLITGVDAESRGIPGPVPDCGYTVGETPVPVPLDKPLLGRHLLKIDYFTSDGGEGLVERTPVWFQAGLHSLYMPVDGLFDHIGVQLSSPGAPVCVAKVEVGQPVVSGK
ncbi:ArnT family glycosyltransferase [Amycolatopsis rifamycinica]|uniref:Glycosyltransferase RgtA/B/C/D-like domain-containing protein n=1 Tax=Amycolatopsis rifamycinica TaxID=287986 RepID=A0A066U0D4_9PSEU|nr:hypothetical protein [Amycolatopsis rifamycinica]KDN20560.1 hypothetical protein DV20_19290 [Amycolatopsis rifamycinica]